MACRHRPRGRGFLSSRPGRRSTSGAPGTSPAGEAWLFTSPRLLAYAAVMAACFHLFVTGYEERTLARRFGPDYLAYRRAVPRWIPRKPAYPAGGGTTGGGKSRV